MSPAVVMLLNCRLPPSFARRRWEIGSTEKTLAEMTQASPETVAEQMRVAGYVAGADPSKVRVFGSNVGELVHGIYQSVSQVFQGASPFTVIHERTHDQLKMEVANGTVSMADAEQAARTWLGDKAPETLSEEAVHEAVAEMGEAYFAGNFKRMEALPASVRGFIARMAVFFREVFQRSAQMVQLQSEGKLDADWQAFLARAVGMDEHAARSGETDATASNITEAEQLAGDPSYSLKVGASLNSQKKEIPKTEMRMPRFFARGEFEMVAARVVDWMKNFPTAVAPDGRTILIANPQAGTLETRAEHWMGSFARDDYYKQHGREARIDKIQSISAIPDTITGAQVKARSHTGAIIYLRRYAGGELHAVFTDEEGRLTGYGLVQGGVETQYTVDPVAGIDGAEILEDWTEKVAPAYSVNQQADAESDRSSTPGRLPKDQQGGTPSASVHGELDAAGNIVKALPAATEGTRAPKSRGETEIKRSPAGESGVPGHSSEKGGERTSFSIERSDDAEGSNASPGGHASDTPPIPRVNSADKFTFEIEPYGKKIYKYKDADLHGLSAEINLDGVMFFNVERDASEVESGTDMFASLMQRLKADGVELNAVAGLWVSGPKEKSVNYHQYLENLKTMEPEAAAENTWTGRIVRKFGYTDISFCEGEVDENSVKKRGNIVVFFKK